MGDRSPGVHWLGEPTTGDPANVGPAIAALSRLSTTLPVPRGFCLTIPPYEVSPAGQLRPDSGVLEAQYAVMVPGERRPPVDVALGLVSPPSRAAGSVPPPCRFRNVRGIGSVADAVAECVGVYIRWRRRLSDDPGPHVAVLVAAFVAADVCALVTASPPGEPDLATFTIEASWGIGEVLVERVVIPDVFELSRSDLTVSRRTVGDKRRMCVPATDGLAVVDVPARLTHVPCLTEARLGEVARLARDAELLLAAPGCLEVALDRTGLRVVWYEPLPALLD